MKEIYVVYTGCYSAIEEHGYFTEENKAKEYCEFMNRPCTNTWNEYRYYKLEPINLLERKAKSVSLFMIETQGWSMAKIEGRMIESEEAQYYKHRCKVRSGNKSEFDETQFELKLVFTGLEDKNHARKSAQDLIAMIREKYYECNDWKLTMECFGGELW